MKVTQQLAKEIFKRYNILCFGGNLPEISICLTTARRQLGCFEFPVKSGRTREKRLQRLKDCRIKLSRCFDMSESEITDIIIHEMIHYHIWLNVMVEETAHGAEFKKLMKSINDRFGRNISTWHKLNDSLLDTDCSVKKHYICLLRWEDGMNTITQCATTRIFEIDDCFGRQRGVREKYWFFTKDSWFNRFPVSRVAKCYKISESDMDAHLKTARRLERRSNRFIISEEIGYPS